jgi:hypothetical protein
MLISNEYLFSSYENKVSLISSKSFKYLSIVSNFSVRFAKVASEKFKKLSIHQLKIIESLINSILFFDLRIYKIIAEANIYVF